MTNLWHTEVGLSPNGVSWISYGMDGLGGGW